MSLTQTEQKILSANTAVETLIEKGFIFSGMKIGLGTGSTALPAVKRLSEFIKDGTLKDIKAVVTSFQTENACADWGIPVYSFKDRIINGSLDKLWNMELDGYALAAAPQIGSGFEAVRLGYPIEYGYFNAGVNTEPV